jgi:hypothetical protein
MITLSIRCGELAPFSFAVPPEFTVQQLRQALASGSPLSRSPGVASCRLITSGRLLSDASARLSSLGLLDGSAVHVVLGSSASAAPAAPGGAAPPGLAPPASLAALLGGGGLPPPPPPPPEGAPGPKGFNRLALVGLDEEGISLIRSLFLPEVLRDVAPLLPRGAGETEAARVLRMEDFWMGAQGDDSDFAVNLAPMLADAGGGAGSMAALRTALGLPQSAPAAPQGLPPWIFHPTVFVPHTHTHTRARARALARSHPHPHTPLFLSFFSLSFFLRWRCH